MLRNMEIAWYFMQQNFTFHLAAFFVFKLLTSSGENNLITSVSFGLFQCIRDTFFLSILIQCMFMQSSFDIDIVDSGHINDIEAQNRAWHFWESDINIQVELKLSIFLDDTINWYALTN